MSAFLDRLPADAAAARASLYAGAVYRLAANPASLALVDHARAAVDEHGVDGARQALRGDHARALALDVVRWAGQGDAMAIDHVRLRAVTTDGHTIAAAAPAYYAHRDTWYANPAAQLNWWIALDDTDGGSFALYPAAFAVAVANDSAGFDYDAFVRLAGWQNRDRDPAAVYPRATADWPRQPALPVAARRGEVIVFSAAHLHQTRPNLGHATRYSVDFRTVHLGDHGAGVGAPNVDGRCTGDAMVDYPRVA